MKTSGFFTDATLCIGCKACEVACKEWNELPADGYVWSGLSYDNTRALGASTWRHVMFVERDEPGSWQFLSDVCRHCGVAGCLEACPTGALVRTEVGSVFLQPDVCNGCAYCVVSCPFGVVERSLDDGRAFKCTFCYDRQKAGLVPACAKACPTESIRFGELETLRLDAQVRLEELRAEGVADAVVYDPLDTSIEGLHAFFLVRGDPRAFNLPEKPEAPTVYLGEAWRSAGAAAAALLVGALGAFLLAGRR